jgi:hypothetical protein
MNEPTREQVSAAERLAVRYDDTFAQTMAMIVAAITNEMDAKLTALEARLAEFAFRGAWIEGRQYKRGNFVTLGSVWHAAVDTRSKPGTDSDWVLVMSKPRDGKDAPLPEPPEPRTVRSAERASQDVIVRRR